VPRIMGRIRATRNRSALRSESGPTSCLPTILDPGGRKHAGSEFRRSLGFKRQLQRELHRPQAADDSPLPLGIALVYSGGFV
jgi:hypothetical protein